MSDAKYFINCTSITRGQDNELQHDIVYCLNTRISKEGIKNVGENVFVMLFAKFVLDSLSAPAGPLCIHFCK